MTQVNNRIGESGDGVCIGGRDSTTLITPNQAMSFKYFRPTLRKVTTTQKAPAFKNTASAERFIDHTKAADILTNHSVKKHLAEVNFEDHGHSVLKESGVTRGHSVLQNSFSEKLSGRDSILGGAGKQNESQFGEDGLRAAGSFGKGMAGEDLSGFGTGNPIGDAVGCGLGVAATSAAVAGTTFTAGGLTPLATASAGATGLACGRTAIRVVGAIIDWFSDDEEQPANNETTPPASSGSDSGGGSTGGQTSPEAPMSEPANPSGRPGPDDNGGSEGGFMTWKLQDQLSGGFKNAKDPIINPSDDNQGGGVLTATELKEMEAELRNAKDPATNWGDENYNNFVGNIEMNVGEISLKNTATNWGDNYTSTTANVVDTVFTVQDVF